MIQENEIYHTNNGDLKVIKYESWCRVHIEFVKTGFNRTARSDHILNGKVLDPMVPAVYSIGFIGSVNSEHSKEAYSRWNDMLTRCYSSDFQGKNITYKGCTVCDDWHNLQNFLLWFNENYIKGYELDKDIKVKGNKVYSPETCLFVPGKINSLLVDRGASRGSLPIGVTSQKNTKLFKSRVAIDGKTKNLGYFKTPGKAHEAYVKAKNSEIMRKCKQYPDLERYLINHIMQ